MLDRKKYEAIEMLVYSDKNKTEIAEELGIQRSTLYNWHKEEEFKEVLEQELNNKLAILRNEFKRDSSKVYNRILKVALNSETENKDVISAAKFLLEQSLGKAMSTIDVTTNQKIEVGAEKEDILEIFDREEEQNV